MAVFDRIVVYGGVVMLTNADCTLYLYDKSSGGFTRHAIKGVYWLDGRGGTITKNGIQSADSVTVYIYSDKVIPKTTNKDMIVRGIVDYEFDNTSQQTISASLKEFKAAHPEAVTVTAINNYMHGGLPHYEINAR